MRQAKAEETDYVASTGEDRSRVRTLVRSGRWLEAEPDSERLASYVSRHLAAAPAGAEAIQGATNDLQAARFLVRGALARRAVGYVEVTTAQESRAGTGFLVSPTALITNAHVIPDVASAGGAVVTFDRELTEYGRPRPTTSFLLDPSRLAVFSGEDALDYALIGVGERTAGEASLEELGQCPLSDRGDKHVIGMPVNIIQHPRGWPKMIAVRNNFLAYRTDQTLLYETDTDEGSSGSPVFNDDWEVVALHHWAQPHLETSDQDGNPFPVVVNEGIRISAIYGDLTAQQSGLPSPAQRDVLAEVLAAATSVAAETPAHTLSPAGSTGQQTRRTQGGEALEEAAVDAGAPDGSVRIVIPLEISVRIAGPTSDEVRAPTGPVTPPARVLSRGPEAVKVDQNYDNRTGYDPTFIPNHEIALPAIDDAALDAQLAPLRPDAPAPAGGELKYEHFSVKMNKATRIAIFTATNIDGPTYLIVDRETGQVGGSEGDRWFKDTRISASYYLDQSFYGGWSDYFDRGHLTRRTDPTWGTPDEAERANADTFHFTNCSPQHFRFNQTAKFWQGVERYVLENGLLANDAHKRLCVLQGPIFDPTIDRWADDVQIPSSFWKIVAWAGAGDTLKSVGLVVDQLPLLDESRTYVGRPVDLPAVDVRHWRVPVVAIQARTGLDFGAALRAADTINQPGQPAVGAEAALLVTRFEDIRL